MKLFNEQIIIHNSVDCLPNYQPFSILFPSTVLDGRKRPFNFSFELNQVYFLAEGLVEKKKYIGFCKHFEDLEQIAINFLTHHSKQIEANKAEQKISEEFAMLDEVFTRRLEFNKWGLYPSYVSAVRYPVFIFDSNQARVKFSISFTGDQWDSNQYIDARYARKHTSIFTKEMSKIENRCWFWYKSYYFLPFLNGSDPFRHECDLFTKYRKSKYAKELFSLSSVDWSCGYISLEWENFGKEIWDLFNIENSNKWNAFSDYLRKYIEYSKYNYPRYPSDAIID